MAKKEIKAKEDDLGGLPPELQVDDSKKEPSNNETVSTAISLKNDKSLEAISKAKAAGYVVVQGRSVQHDGVLYSENKKIILNEKDALRLVKLGVIISLEDIAKTLAEGPIPGTVTVNGD